MNQIKHNEYNKYCGYCGKERTHIHLGDGEYKCTYCRTKHHGRWKKFEEGDGTYEECVTRFKGQSLNVSDYQTKEENELF